CILEDIAKVDSDGFDDVNNRPPANGRENPVDEQDNSPDSLSICQHERRIGHNILPLSNLRLIPRQIDRRTKCRKLERVHSDICSQYPESKGNSIYNLTFLDNFTHWCWTKSIPNQNSDTIREAFHDLLKQIKNEMELN